VIKSMEYDNFSFSVLALLFGRLERHLACKNSILVVVVDDLTAVGKVHLTVPVLTPPPYSLASVKSRMQTKWPLKQRESM